MTEAHIHHLDTGFRLESNISSDGPREIEPMRKASWMLHLLACLAILIPAPLAAGSGRREGRPNIVYILADDLGYGDVRCLNPSGKIATPNLDRLAAAGMVFTDAHSGSAVCSPTRYGILTGRYAWRSRLQAGVLGGCSPRLIEPGRLTVAELLRRAGYHTAAVGKWHLGMDWALRPGKPRFTDAIEKGADGWNVDFTRPIAGGPNLRWVRRVFRDQRLAGHGPIRIH